MTRHVTFLILVLNALAVYRAAILVTRDKITKPFRDWLDRRYTGVIVEFIFCPWCVSIWAGAGATVLTVWCWGWWQWVCLGAACSATAGFLGEHS